MPKIKKSDFTNFLTAKTISYLEFLGCSVWRENNIAAPKRRFVGKKGKSDIAGVTKNGIGLYVEIKTPGDRMSKDQKEFQRMILKTGALYFIVERYSDWETISEKLKYTNEENRNPETSRTKEEIRDYAKRESTEILKKENEWDEHTKEKRIIQNKKAKLRRELKKISKKFYQKEGETAGKS